jgi:hypothetical protein
MKRQHNKVEVLSTRVIYSADGTKRELDGAVVAGDCAGILEAKQVLDVNAVHQLTSCLEFIRCGSSHPLIWMACLMCMLVSCRANRLTGAGACLNGKKLVGYVAGKTITSDPDKINALVMECKKHGYGIFVASGNSLSLGNSRMPRLQVKCVARSFRPGSCRGSSHLLRVRA